MKKVITTVGKSIFDNYREYKNNIDTHYGVIKDKLHSEWNNCSDRIIKVKSILIPWAKDNENASAEIKSILKIYEMLKEDLEVHLLATDTIVSRCACEIVKDCLKKHDKITIIFDPSRDVILGLQVNDYKRLKQEGLHNLINRVNIIAGVGIGSTGYFDNMIFNITGGYKAVIPYMTIMAYVNGCKIAYLFEDMESIILIPPLPIKIDVEIFKTYALEIGWLDEGIDNYRHTKNSYYQRFTELERMGLVEEANNIAMLSPVGRIFYEHFQRRMFLFYAPDDVYSELTRQEDIKRILQGKFANRQHRESKTEIKGEHYVYDDGDNKNRIYYFIDRGSCYIYKTFQSEEDAKKFIDTKIDKKDIIRKSRLRELEVQNV